MEKILISFDQNEYNMHISKLNSAASKANQMVGQINEVNGYQMSPADVQDAIRSRGERASVGVRKASEVELDRLNIRSKALRENTIKSDQEAYYSVLNKYADLREYGHDLAINDDCTVRIASGVEQRVRDQYSYYIQTEKGKAIYEAQQKVVEGMNEILKLSNRLSSHEVGRVFSAMYGKREVELIHMRYDDM